MNNWLAKCRDSGAAKIRIYNDIDDEQIPTRLDPGFTYIESGYDLYVLFYRYNPLIEILSSAVVTFLAVI